MTIVLTIIYLLGYIVNFIVSYRAMLKENKELTVGDLTLISFISIFSWISFIITLLFLYGDTVIVRKKS